MGFGYTERGFVMPRQKTVTAYGNPVTLEAAKRLRQLTIYGNAVQSNLPSGYTEVGYIESSGTQYIDTGVCPTNNTKVEVVFENVNNEKFVYGSRSSADDTIAAHAFFASSSSMCFPMFGTYISAVGVSMADNRRHKAEISQAGAYLNGNLIRSYDTMDFTSTLNMFLCGLNQNGNMDSRTFVGKIYSFRVWESGELIQSLVPCKRDSDGAVGMYDTVTGAFLGNGGTGVFVAGAAVTPTPDTPVDIQLCGDRTGNLYNVNDKYGTWNTAVTDDAGWITVNYDNTEGTSRNWPSLYTNFRDVIEPSTEYTIVTEIEYISGCALHPNTTGSPKSAFNTLFGYTTQGTHYRTVTSESDLSDCVTLLRSNYLVEPGNIGSAKFRISLFKGSYTAETIPAYEPYGYKVSGRVEGVNLFDKGNATLGYRLTENGAVHNSDSAGKNSFVSDYISVDPNTIYSLNYAITISETTDYERACFYDADKQFVSQANAGARTFTTPQNASYVRLCRLQTHLDDTMLLKCSYTADTIPPYTPYQPPQDFAVYLPQQIAKVGDVADTVVLDMEKRTAELVQRVRRYDFTGSETITTQEDTTYPGGKQFVVQRLALGLEAKRYTVTCNRLKQHAYMNNTDNTIFAHNNEFFIYYSAMDTPADLKAFLAANPTYAYVQYATPVTTDITAMQDWDAMPQVKGTVTLTLSAEVEPSGAEAVYISSRSPKPKVQTISDVVINEADPEHTEASGQEQADEAAALNIEMITYE